MCVTIPLLLRWITVTPIMLSCPCNGSVVNFGNNNHAKTGLSDGSKRDERDQFDNLVINNLNWNIRWTQNVCDKAACRTSKTGRLNVRSQVVTTVGNILTTIIISCDRTTTRAIEEQMSIDEERVKIADRKIRWGLAARLNYLQAKVDLNAQKAAQRSSKRLSRS